MADRVQPIKTVAKLELSEADIAVLMVPLKDYHGIFSPLLRRREQREWLVLRRNVATGEVKFYLSNASDEVELISLVRISGMRWPV